MKRQVFLTVILLLFSLNSKSLHGQNVKTEIQNCFLEINRGNPFIFDYQLLEDKRNAKKALKILPEYYFDSLGAIRMAAAELTFQCGYLSGHPKTRQTSVEYLTFIGKNKDLSLASYALKKLTAYKTEDFSPKSKSVLRDLVNKQHHNYELVVKLTGLAGMREMIPVYKAKLVHDTLLNKHGRWWMHLAMARLGDTTEINYCLIKTKRMPVNDHFIYHYAPDLIYTRQKKALDYVVEILNSEQKSCVSSHPDYPRNIKCGYRAMEYLAPAVQDYPYKLLASGDLDVEDYKNALLDIRQWFAENPDYEIIANNF
jgi:hypothetical protein